MCVCVCCAVAVFMRCVPRCYECVRVCVLCFAVNVCFVVILDIGLLWWPS